MLPAVLQAGGRQSEAEGCKHGKDKQLHKGKQHACLKAGGAQ
jgi:hypothetical protein